MSRAEEIRHVLRRFPRRGIRRWGASRAAVAVTIVTSAGGPGVLLTRRADALRTPSGHLALPGGPTDRGQSASDAARRALTEELGMRLSPSSVLGLLDDYLTHSRLVITPVVVWAGDHDEPLRLQQVLKQEVPKQAPAAEVFAVPFTDLDVEPVFVASSESDRPVIRLPLHGGWLHAPTAAVLHQFREVILHHRCTRVAHLEQPAFAWR
ncbi:MAG: CoA pyrophosphatase [Actinomycetota bacterium]|nr:CoA pyrophosphatase [Actinomycetota bacterium]